MLFTRVRREGQGQRERRELSEGGRWALTQDAVRNGIPAPDPQVKGSAELLAIRMTLKMHLTSLHPTSLPSGLQRGPPRGDRSAPVNSLAEKDTNGGTERRGARQGNWTRPSTGRWRWAPDGGGTAPPQKTTRAAPRAASFDGRAGSPAARKEHAAGQVAPDDRQAGRGPRCHDSQSGAVQASHRRRCQGDPAAGQKPKRLAESQGRPESRGAKATGPHCTDRPPVPQSQ